MEVRRWVEASSGGLMLRMMMLVAPWRMMSSSASCMLPSPKAISEMTAAVPMMMPRTDRKARSLCSQRLRTARMKLRDTLSHRTITLWPVILMVGGSADGEGKEGVQVGDQGGRLFVRGLLHARIALIALDQAVAQADD